ncbi:hypothetical protein BJP41_03940 [Candidatus Williamhamiltonella defendens]|uniref:Uncharacterized protein n=1 Tax=Candidatus Williamhamiltonella defendens TaxID=138072 RepID=A0A2D3T1S5_9ENTR|nr:hypothetical protein CJJ18_04365 [Candidatus Hamiltonella defensa]ATW29644.1 hypothetical protein BJP41_03940 [Candidatus Hamiltonella defensa]ATW31621.1 hypothetical protein BJP42_04010 [Candidatus Hamiltonella defensa]AWK16351.1 hypothetical protein CCS40_04215 [Candidatus Hamiltonella defensa]
MKRSQAQTRLKKTGTFRKVVRYIFENQNMHSVKQFEFDLALLHKRSLILKSSLINSKIFVK